MIAPPAVGIDIGAEQLGSAAKQPTRRRAGGVTKSQRREGVWISNCLKTKPVPVLAHPLLAHVRIRRSRSWPMEKAHAWRPRIILDVRAARVQREVGPWQEEAPCCTS